MSEHKYLLHVNGITCANCIKKLEDTEGYPESVGSARVYFGQSLLEIQSSDPIEQDVLLEKIKQLGFKAEILENQQQGFQANKKENRARLAKLGVAGFCAGNIMLATIPLYTGVENLYKTAFAYMSFLLFLPILFYSSLDFYKNAWNSLKSKNLSIDLPISIAVIFGFLFSTWNLITGHSDFLYYDSTASFLFLILGVRFLLNKLQQNYIATYSETDFGLKGTYQVNGISQTKEAIQIGDRIVLTQGQTLPVKSKVLTDNVEWNLSLMSGEGYPRSYHSEMEIESGAVLISDLCQLTSLETYGDSRILGIQTSLEELKKSKGEFVQFTDRFSHYFVMTVFSIAILFFAYYAQVDAFEAFQRSLALLIVACPCALALGTPLAYLLGVYRAKKAGILIYKKDIFDRILEVKNIFFDKTGTLTKGILEISSVSDNDPKWINIILNLEAKSNHPVAFALRKKYGNLFTPLKIGAQERTGTGVTGLLGSDHFEFIKNSDQSSMSSSLFCNGKEVLNVQFKDSLWDDTKEELDKTLDVNIYLLTGDKAEVANSIAVACGIKNVLSDHSPEMKLEIIDAHQPALMIGDGLNDALALQKAHVGIAVQGSVQLSAESSDAYFLKSGISQLRVLHNISQSVRATVFSNLGISLVYNFIAGALALAGYINPLVAAILMPISSVLILFNTLRGVR